MAITTEQNTELARKYGLIGANETAGGGLVAQRLQQAAAKDPSVLAKYEQERQTIGGTPYQATTVRANLSQPQPSNKTGVTVAELRKALSDSGNYAGIMNAQFNTWAAGQSAANQAGRTYGYQKNIDDMYNQYVKPTASVSLPPPPSAPAPTTQAPQQPTYQPPTYQPSAPKSYQDYYQQDTQELQNLGAPIPLKRPDQMAIPDFLRDFQDYSGQQQRSGIATKGLYGGGVEDVGSRYFLNSLLREYLNQDNQATGYDLLPVEEQYLQSLGVPITSSTGSEDFLRQLGLYYKQLGGL